MLHAPRQTQQQAPMRISFLTTLLLILATGTAAHAGDQDSTGADARQALQAAGWFTGNEVKL